MEELAHLHLNHKPSQLIVLNGAIAVRSFRKSQETQAYWVGAAALVPLVVLQNAQQEIFTRERVAHDCGVSTALIEFRERVTGIKLK